MVHESKTDGRLERGGTPPRRAAALSEKLPGPITSSSYLAIVRPLHFLAARAGCAHDLAYIAT